MQTGGAAVRLLNAMPAPVAAYFRTDALPARLLRPLLNRLLPSGYTPAVVRSGPGEGLRLLVDPRTEKFYWTGLHERAVQDALTAELKAGMTVWDVGAHIGFFSLLASRLVGPSGRVLAFEPLESNRARLRVALELNGAANVAVHDCALADSPGERVLYAHGATLMWTLVPERGERDGLTIRCSTLDEIAASSPPPNLVKIDAEGAEVDVLRGGLGLVQAHRPKLLFELQDERLLAEARILLPEYDCRQIDAQHWLSCPR